jgi:hypothetical protein
VWGDVPGADAEIPLPGQFLGRLLPQIKTVQNPAMKAISLIKVCALRAFTLAAVCAVRTCVRVAVRMWVSRGGAGCNRL